MCSIPRRSAGASPHWPLLQQAIGYLPAHRSAIRRGRAQRREAGVSSASPGISAWALPVYVFWVVESAARRASSASCIPNAHALGIDFLLPIYFLGLVMGFRKPAVVAAGGGGQRCRLDHRLQDRRLALACLDRRDRRRAAGRHSSPAKAEPRTAMSDDHLDHHRRRGADLSHPHRRPSGAVAFRAHPSARRGRPQRGAGRGADDAGGAGRDGWRTDRAIALSVAGLVALRGGLLAMFLTGAAVLIVLRYFVG